MSDCGFLVSTIEFDKSSTNQGDLPRKKENPQSAIRHPNFFIRT